MNQKSFNTLSTWLIWLAPTVSLAFALWHQGCKWCHYDRQVPECVRFGIVALWALIPPAWLWYDWLKYGQKAEDRQREYMMHLHGLVRNVWIALTLVLSALLDVKLSIE